MPQVGDNILHYQILDHLGKGGMGEVFKALDTKLDREVALKFLLNQDQLEPEQKERLIVEAKAVAKLDHNNIGVIYAIESLEDQLFLAMALYRGESLDQQLAKGPLPLDKTLELAKQILLGLAHAHTQEVVHRDIKPANIFVTSEGLVKILDFGLARLSDSNLTLQGQFMGSPSYMAPEQIKHEGVDHKADIWSLGVLLFQLLTGELPFEGRFPQVMVSILKEDPKPLRQYQDHPALQALIERCLAKDKLERFESCQALKQALETLEPSKILTPKVTQQQRSRRHLASFVGRDEDVKQLVELLTDEDSYLVTITGIGGAGKTSLAKALMLEPDLLGHYLDGVHFVALDALTDASQIPTEIASTLKPDLSRDQAWTQLALHFESKRSLLILDNLEHLIDDVAGDLEDFLEACPNLTILATSREVLNIAGEVAYQLKGLSLPPSLETDFDAYGATQLFIQLAKRFKRSFEIEKHKAAVLSICQQLKGWPLGIELAVAWIKQLNPEDIASRLHENLDLLASRSRSKVSRHRSARAAFDYSWELLKEIERGALAKLAVFQGGFTTEAAFEVAAVPIHMLASLLDKSLITLDEGRYDQHPLLHQFCLEKLEQLEQASSVRTTHAEYYLVLAERAYSELKTGRDEAQWYARLAAEHQNLVSATRWAFMSEDGPLVAKMVIAIYFLMERRVGISWTELNVPLDTLPDLVGEKVDERSRALLLRIAADFEIDQENYDAARALFEEGLRIAHALEDNLVLSRLYNALYGFAVAQQDLLTAKEYAEKSLHFMRLIDSKDGISLSLRLIGEVEIWQGHYDKADALFTEAVNVARASGNQTYLAEALRALGFNTLHLGNFEAAYALLLEGEKIYTELGSRQEVSINLPMAYYHLLQGDYEKAKALFLEDVANARKLHYLSSNAAPLRYLGHIAIEQNDLDLAEQYLKESCQLENQALWSVAVVVEYAKLSLLKQSYQTGVQLYAYAMTTMQQYSFVLTPYRKKYHQRAIQEARETLNEADFECYWEEGKALTTEQAIKLVLSE